MDAGVRMTIATRVARVIARVAAIRRAPGSLSSVSESLRGYNFREPSSAVYLPPLSLSPFQSAAALWTTVRAVSAFCIAQPRHGKCGVPAAVRARVYFRR